MKRVGTVTAILVILALAAPAATQARVSGTTDDKAAATDWIVTVRAGVKARDVARDLARGAGGSAGQIFEHALRGFVFHGSAKAAAALKRDRNVRTVVSDHPVKIAADTLPAGVERIRASHPTAPDAQEAGFKGAGARVAVIDTGIDLTHPDLLANLDVGLGINCMTSGPPQDGHGHGTHVAGTIGARAGNNIGVIGVAPEVRLVPVKVLNDQGEGNWSNVICGIDHVTALATDTDPANDVDVVNMSLGDVGDVGTCSDGGLREAICRSVGAGVVYVAAAGNSFTDASGFIPAAFPEVIAVSATSDFDGEPGGAAGCRFILELFGYYCDDEIAAFSNVGSVVDVAAPGVQVFSTWTGGTYQNSSGTSMAAPHVAGVAALVRAANQTLSPTQVASIVERTGEFPDGSTAQSGCGSAAQWPGDRDGIAEPFVNALRAAQTAAGGGTSTLPTLTLTPADGTTVSGPVAISATASHSSGITSVEFLADGISLGTDTTAPYTASWDSMTTYDGVHTITARATATNGEYACRVNSLTVGPGIQGDWVGTYGVDGYALGAWNGTMADDDLVVLPNATLTLEQGDRYVWTNSTTDRRALQSPDRIQRRSATWYDASQLRMRLDFSAAYTGTLHLYTVDFDSSTRRQNVTVTDGTTTRSVAMTGAYDAGAWLHFPVSVTAGGTVRITADYVAGFNPNIAGLFLGGAGEPPDPAPPPPPPSTDVDSPGVRGDWVGTYGVDGYALAAWNGTTATSDLVVMPRATLTLDEGSRFVWTSATTDARALESPDQTERRSATWYHASQLQLRLDFSAAYEGTLHVYAVDFDSNARRQSVTVADGSTTKTIAVAIPFDAGAWLHFPISVAAGGTVRVTADHVAGMNPIISGLFLGGSGAPPMPGDWVGTYGADGYALGAWNGTAAAGDLVVMPIATLTLEQGNRYVWTSSTNDPRALESPDGTGRRSATWYHPSQLRLRLDFSASYSGALHLYAVDFDTNGRRQNVTVTDSSTTKTIAMTRPFDAGAWLHFPIDVRGGGTVRVTVDYVAGLNPIIAGLFLGDGGGTGPLPAGPALTGPAPSRPMAARRSPATGCTAAQRPATSPSTRRSAPAPPSPTPA